jgi:hypothetical protein
MSIGMGSMGLRPVQSNAWSHRVKGVRIYLDDIEGLVRGLSEHDSVVMTIRRFKAEDSIFDEVDDLIGRVDVDMIVVELIQSDDDLGLPVMHIDISSLSGVEIYGIRDSRLEAIARHFTDSLDRVSYPWWSRFFGPRLKDAEIVLSRRSSAMEQRERRRHDMWLATWSGAAGALLGAVATAIVAVFQS